jgi:hypothetical protein
MPRRKRLYLLEMSMRVVEEKCLIPRLGIVGCLETWRGHEDAILVRCEMKIEVLPYYGYNIQNLSTQF